MDHGIEIYPALFESYIALVPEAEVMAVLESQSESVRKIAAEVAYDRERYRYARGEWSIREVFGHVGDAERIFGFRAFWFARGGASPLSGFDQVKFAQAALSDQRSVRSLLEEWICARRANLYFFRSLSPETWDCAGEANGEQLSVRTLARIAAGHVYHHLNVLHERYGVCLS